MSHTSSAVVIVFATIALIISAVVLAYVFYGKQRERMVVGIKWVLPDKLPAPSGRLLPVEVIPKLPYALPMGHSVVLELVNWTGLQVQIPSSDAGKIVSAVGILRLNANGVPFVGQLNYQFNVPTADTPGSVRVMARGLGPVSVVLKDAGPYVIQVDLDSAYKDGSVLSAPTVDQKQLLDGYIPYELYYTLRVVPDSEIRMLS